MRCSTVDLLYVPGDLGRSNQFWTRELAIDWKRVFEMVHSMASFSQWLAPTISPEVSVPRHDNVHFKQKKKHLEPVNIRQESGGKKPETNIFFFISGTTIQPKVNQLYCDQNSAQNDVLRSKNRHGTTPCGCVWPCSVERKRRCWWRPRPRCTSWNWKRNGNLESMSWSPPKVQWLGWDFFHQNWVTLFFFFSFSDVWSGHRLRPLFSPSWSQKLWIRWDEVFSCVFLDPKKVNIHELMVKFTWWQPRSPSVPHIDELSPCESHIHVLRVGHIWTFFLCINTCEKKQT